MILLLFVDAVWLCSPYVVKIVHTARLKINQSIHKLISTACLEFMVRACGKIDLRQSCMFPFTYEIILLSFFPFPHRCTCSLGTVILVFLGLMLLWKLIYQSDDCQTSNIAAPYLIWPTSAELFLLVIKLLECLYTFPLLVHIWWTHFQQQVFF